jgi:hypothetical protein
MRLLPEGQLPVDCQSADWRDQIIDRLNDRGLAIYRDLSEPAELLRFAEDIGSIFHHRDGEEDGFSYLRVGTEGERTTAQFPHTDSAGEPTPPDIMIIHCVQTADGGQAVLSDGKAFCEALAVDDPVALHAIQDQSIGCIRSGPKVFEGPFLARDAEGRFRLRFRPDNEVVSPLLAEHLPTILHTAGVVAERTQLPRGGGYILRNDRWLHGRTGFPGEREVLRLLVDVVAEKPLGRRLGQSGFTFRGG